MISCFYLVIGASCLVTIYFGFNHSVLHGSYLVRVQLCGDTYVGEITSVSFPWFQFKHSDSELSPSVGGSESSFVQQAGALSGRQVVDCVIRIISPVQTGSLKQHPNVVYIMLFQQRVCTS